MSAVIKAVSPLDGAVLGTYTCSSNEDITQQVKQARIAASEWAAMSVAARATRLAPLTDLILADLDELTTLIARTTGKVAVEALLGEIFPVLAQQRYYQTEAESILKARPVKTSSFAFPDATAIIERKPYGVVAVISPWNYPWQLSLIPILTALYAGNSVILKASEFSLPVAAKLMALFAQLKVPEHLLQWVIGAGEQAQQLLAARPDLVFFTGSCATGRKVMAQAAIHPIPVLLELGGNDVMIVFADADLERAANAALYGAFCNSGQVCAAVKRLLVEDCCHTEFLHYLQTGLSQLKLDRDIGALINDQQIQQVEAHYQDAVAKGAQASSPLQRQGNYLQPVLLWQATPAMRVIQEETFGPLLPILSFTGQPQAISLANDTEFGLNASVWSKDITKAEAVARQLLVGNWAVNDVLKNIGHAGLPFGGVKNSGFGRYHGAEGLLSFSQSVAGLTSYNTLPHEPNWFPYTDSSYSDFKGYLDFLFGQGSWLQRGMRNQQALAAFRAYSGLHLRQSWHNLKTFWQGG